MQLHKSAAAETMLCMPLAPPARLQHDPAALQILLCRTTYHVWGTSMSPAIT